MRKIRIAVLGHKRIPSREGGIEVAAEELGSRLAQMGCDVTCYNRSGHHVSGAKYDGKTEVRVYKGMRLKKVPTLDIRGAAAASSSFFATLFSAVGRYDVVHIHAEGPAVFCWLPRIFGKKIVVTVHGLDWRREKWKGGFSSWYIRLGERMAVKFANEVIVLSKGVQSYFMDTYGRRTELIPNGVNVFQRIPACEITARYGLTPDEYILFLSRLVPEKGLKNLILAYQQIHTEKKLVIAGGGSDSEEFEAEMKKLAGTHPKILFTGFVQGTVLEELYSNAYFYVLPSDLEGLPLSLLEAMSYGNCCLVSDLAECADVIEDKGVTFRKGDVKDLAKKLQLLCDRPELVEQYRTEAADFVCRKYSWDRMAERTMELYRKSLKTGRKRK